MDQSASDIATPRRLFEKHYEPSISLYANYSTIDGQRFVMVKRLDQRDAPVRIDVTVNWFGQLKRATQRKVSTGSGAPSAGTPHVGSLTGTSPCSCP
jgi:hypothetical protein